MMGDEENNASGDDWGDALAEQAASSGESADDDWAAALGEQGADSDQQFDKAQLPSFDGGAGTGAGISDNLDAILDIPVTIAMELGRTQITIANLLKLNQGSVVSLDRLAGEPLDVTVNGTLIAHGEVVVVNEKFGIRLTDVISPSERVTKLQ